MAEGRIPAALRREIVELARGFCEYCRGPERYSIYGFAVDHIIPRSKGGATELANLAFACQGCNAHKYNKTNGIDPVSGKAAPLYHPRRHRWRDHFGWSGDFTMVIGLSPIGRATVEELRLNRQGAINLRRLLHSAGEHPPRDPDG